MCEYIFERVREPQPNILGYSHDMCNPMYVEKTFKSARRSGYRFDRHRLFIAQNKLCYWCGRKCVFNGTGATRHQFTIDHVIPLGFGGTNHWMNLVGSCFRCNCERERRWKHYQNIVINVISSMINTMGDIYDNRGSKSI